MGKVSGGEDAPRIGVVSLGCLEDVSCGVLEGGGELRGQRQSVSASHGQVHRVAKLRQTQTSIAIQIRTIPVVIT